MGTFTLFCSAYIFITAYGFWLSPVLVSSLLFMKKAEETIAVNVEVAGLENGVKF